MKPVLIQDPAGRRVSSLQRVRLACATLFSADVAHLDPTS